MTRVRIIKNYDWPPLLRQTPGGKGIWNGIAFTEEPVEHCDYTIILNSVPHKTSITCPTEHIWAIMQEPPIEFKESMHKGAGNYHQIYTQSERLMGSRYIRSHPALPWIVDKSYDELQRCAVPDKPLPLSCIISDAAMLQGHRARLRFVQQVRAAVDLDIFGRGLRPIRDKWDALAKYRYSLVIENFQNPYYWSEKLADSLLAWTMPIYVGCTNIASQFPPRSVIPLDMKDSDAIEKIRQIISSDLWSQNLAAIAEARKLILDHYQLFPFVASEIRKHETQALCSNHRPNRIRLTPYPSTLHNTAISMPYRIQAVFKRYFDTKRIVQDFRKQLSQPSCGHET
jgi:hypothetical protein